MQSPLYYTSVCCQTCFYYTNLFGVSQQLLINKYAFHSIKQKFSADISYRIFRCETSNIAIFIGFFRFYR